MDLTKENVKKLRGLIVFTAVIVVCLWKYEASQGGEPVFKGHCAPYRLPQRLCVL